MLAATTADKESLQCAAGKLSSLSLSLSFLLHVSRDLKEAASDVYIDLQLTGYR